MKWSALLVFAVWAGSCRDNLASPRKDEERVSSAAHIVWRHSCASRPTENIVFSPESLTKAIVACKMLQGTTVARDKAPTGGTRVKVAVWSAGGEMPDGDWIHVDTRADLREWARAATGGLLEAPPAERADGVDAVVVSTLFIALRWHTPFNEALTAGGTFECADGVARDVRMMKSVAMRPYRETAMYRAVQLAGRADDGEELRVDVLLPIARERLDDVEMAAVGEEQATWKYDSELVALAFPKVALACSIDVGGALAAGSGNHEIGEGTVVTQDACAVFTEKGATVAARTTAYAVADPVGFVVDRPFVFVIRSTQGEIYMLGSVRGP